VPQLLSAPDPPGGTVTFSNQPESSIQTNSIDFACHNLKSKRSAGLRKSVGNLYHWLLVPGWDGLLVLGRIRETNKK